MALPKINNPYSRTGKHYKLVRVWGSMKNRCNRPVGKNSCYKGITYDKRWENFDNFYSDFGHGWKPGLTIDRIDSTKNYTKDNCRWVDIYVQANNRSNNRKLTLGGVTQNVAQWSRELGIKNTTIRQRLDAYGWSVEKTLTTPTKLTGKRG